MKTLLNLKGVTFLSAQEQKKINGGLTKTKKLCDSSLCNTVPGRCCGVDSNGNYGCVIANTEMGSVNSNCR
ncbi:hypothetical protein [uncultured Tenacibaculum sp.]|uniref:hypothetical protein n=1 Tax=uncultured Tenacibaculum sp. TaxID=174713 RepID=UPI00260196DE|nr:hypothetical protein [uncultured Tenacibaculum sp.]